MSLSKTHFFTDFYPPHPLVLESGQTLGPITLAYETYGTLNADKSNVILVCHALSGDAHAAFGHEQNPDYIGWWDFMIGDGKPIDTSRYFVICSNVIGGCKGSTGPTSINPDTQQPYGITFPVITIGDMVHAQKRLLDHLEITSLAMVVGGSMGGMQALEWSILYPNMVKTCVPIACTAKLSPQALAFDVVGQQAIMVDPKWQQGHYQDQPEKGLSIARMIGHITYHSDESMHLKFGRKLQQKEDYGYNFTTDFQIESYLKYQGDKFVNRFDANSYLYITKAIDYFDLHKKYGSLEQAFQRTTCQFLVMSVQSDWLYKPGESKSFVHALMRLNKRVTYVELDSQWGHDAFLMEAEPIKQALSAFLENNHD
jgi:homoserine O-acetyltransferase